MRKTSVWVLCVLFVLTTAAFAAAQTTAAPAKQAAGSDMAKPADAGAAATTSTSTTTTETKSTKKTSSKKAKTPSAKGEVTAYDATAKTIAVKGAKADWTFSWDDKTTVTPKGSTPAVGDKVTVWYTTSGDTKTATKIAIAPAKKAAAAKKPA